jgi:hypothetical protein
VVPVVALRLPVAAVKTNGETAIRGDRAVDFRASRSSLSSTWNGSMRPTT